MSTKNVVAALWLVLSSVTYGNSLIVVDAAGRTIGYWAPNSTCEAASGLAAYSSSSYLACFVNGQVSYNLLPPGAAALVNTSYYESSDCSGPAFATESAGEIAGGFVVDTASGVAAAQVGANAEVAYIGSRSVGTTDSPSCELLAPAFYDTVSLFPATALPTGFNPSPYLAPLSVRALPDSALDDTIFFDAFDLEY
jgi:hypothetical protein